MKENDGSDNEAGSRRTNRLEAQDGWISSVQMMTGFAALPVKSEIGLTPRGTMKSISALIIMLVWLGSSVNMLSCERNGLKGNSSERGTNASSSPKTPRQEGATVPSSSDIKELAAGNRSSIFESFVLVARDVQTYAALRAMHSGLPEQSPDFFKSSAVIAAYLGQRRTSGYSVVITRESDGHLRIAEHAPSKDTIVKMVLGAPFKIVATPVDTDRPVILSLDDTWKQRSRPYRVTSGELLITGGFAGVKEKRVLEGGLSIMRTGTLATIVFELQSTGGKQPRKLRDTASGLVDGSGRISLLRVDASALTGAVQSPFRVTGQFTENEQNLNLSFETIAAPNISDNFSATASLKALATAPPPVNQAITGEM